MIGINTSNFIDLVALGLYFTLVLRSVKVPNKLGYLVPGYAHEYFVELYIYTGTSAPIKIVNEK